MLPAAPMIKTFMMGTGRKKRFEILQSDILAESSAIAACKL